MIVCLKPCDVSCIKGTFEGLRYLLMIYHSKRVKACICWMVEYISEYTFPEVFVLIHEKLMKTSAFRSVEMSVWSVMS